MSGYYTFKWDLPASEVYVTGTFDGWSRSTKLDKDGAEFIKKVELPKETILYKFVVDGNWVIDPNAPTETDPSGAQNSILWADRIEIPKIPEAELEQVMEQTAINTVAPESTTAALAATVPKESDLTSGALNVSSAAPESTTAALAGGVPLEMATPGNDACPGGFPATPAEESEPTLATPGNDACPGGFPATPAEESEPTLAPQDQILSIDPLPASDTAENPITLAPGEPVPKDIGTQSITSNVKLDKESYEAGATNYPIGSIALPEVVTPAGQREAEGRGVLDIVPITNNMIPESSLPIVSAAEAEAEIPEIVKESQELAGVPAEASAVPAVVELKDEVESELKSEVPITPPTAEGNVSTPEQPVEVAPTSKATPVVTDGVSSETVVARKVTLNALPVPVKESIIEAGVAADAAREPVAVVQKAAVEEELKQTVKPTEPVKRADVPPKSSIEGKPKKSVEGLDSSDSPKKAKRRSFFGALKEKILHFGRK